MSALAHPLPNAFSWELGRISCRRICLFLALLRLCLTGDISKKKRRAVIRVFRKLQADWQFLKRRYVAPESEFFPAYISTKHRVMTLLMLVHDEIHAN